MVANIIIITEKHIDHLTGAQCKLNLTIASRTEKWSGGKESSLPFCRVPRTSKLNASTSYFVFFLLFLCCFCWASVTPGDPKCSQKE
jgi:hypothetical protein